LFGIYACNAIYAKQNSRCNIIIYSVLQGADMPAPPVWQSRFYVH
jgi:hypothetical protein